jgi:hypothetical protein
MSDYHENKFERAIQCSKCGEHGIEISFTPGGPNIQDLPEEEQKRLCEEVNKWMQEYHKEVSPGCDGELTGLIERLIPDKSEDWKG